LNSHFPRSRPILDLGAGGEEQQVATLLKDGIASIALSAKSALLWCPPEGTVRPRQTRWRKLHRRGIEARSRMR